MNIIDRPKHTNRAYYRAMLAARPNRAARRAAARASAIAAQSIVSAAPVVAVDEAATVSGNVRIYSRPYVVPGPVGFQVVRSAEKPVNAVMGPFKTSRGADYAANNPSVKGVAEAERLAKI